MKKLLFALLILAVLVSATACAVFANAATVTFSLYADTFSADDAPTDNYKDCRDAVKANDKNILYLSADADVCNLKLWYSSSSKDEVKISRPNGEVPVPFASGDKVDLTAYETEDARGYRCYKLSFSIGSTVKAYTVYRAETLPTIYIDTTKAVSALEKDKKLVDTGIRTRVIDVDGTVYYDDYATETCGELKSRGNGSFNLYKKPFQFKLAAKTKLFGLGKAKTFLLLANYDDQSLLRNSIMYRTADELGMLTMDFQSVNLYFNGEYYGVFLLCEKVQINKHRVEITDLEENTELANPEVDLSAKEIKKVTSGDLINNTIMTQYSYADGITDPEDITGGYLVELDNNYWNGEPCSIVTSNNQHYVVKSPEFCSKNEMEYISKIVADLEEAVANPEGTNREGKYYTDYIDLESYARAYVIAEFSKNWDTGSSSIFFYKDVDVDGKQTKLTCGPLWDCDNTLGNITGNGQHNKTNDEWARVRQKFWAMFLQHQDFLLEVANQVEKLNDIVKAAIAPNGFIDFYAAEIGNSIAMEESRWGSDNYKTWPLYYDYNHIHYDEWAPAKPFFSFYATYSDGSDKRANTAIGYIKTFMSGRLKYMNEKYVPAGGVKVSLGEDTIGVLHVDKVYYKANGDVIVTAPGIPLSAIQVIDGAGLPITVTEVSEGVYSFKLSGLDATVTYIG